ncbi:flippase [Natronoarchaeum sp. GCM10025703]|uniref:flippase n=1 Tax=Natronoarchaeum sp. GCM10025703 TaxID=3252685 RepID=UPI003612809B
MARLVYYVTSGLVIVFLSRELMPSDYGKLFFAISVLTVCRLFSSLGIAKSAAKHVSYYLDADGQQVRHVLTQSVRYNAVSISVVAGTVLFGAGTIASALGEPTIAPLLAVGSLYVVFATLYNYTRVVLQGFQDITASATVYASEGVGRIAGVFILVTLGYELLGALVGYIVGFVLAAVIGVWLLAQRIPSRNETDPIENGLVRRMLRYSLPLTVTRGAWVLDREVDIILVGLFLNPAVVGYYVVSKQIMTFATGPAQSIGFSIGPQFNEAAVAENEAYARKTYERVLVYLLLFYLPAVVGLFLLAAPVVTTVFGEQYRDVVPILQTFCAAIVLVAVTKSTEDILDYLGRADSRAVFKILTSAGNVALTVVFIQSLGAIGAAVATVLMQAVYAALCLGVVNTELGLRAGFLLRQSVQVVGISTMLAMVVLVIRGYASSPVAIAGVIVTGTMVWTVLAVFGGSFLWTRCTT